MAEGRDRVLSRGWMGMRGEGWGQTSSGSTVAGCCDCENVAEGWWPPSKWLPGSPCYLSSITYYHPVDGGYHHQNKVQKTRSFRCFDASQSKNKSFIQPWGWVKVSLSSFTLKQKSSTCMTCSPGSTLSTPTRCRKRSISCFGGRGEISALSALILSSWPQFM